MGKAVKIDELLTQVFFKSCGYECRLYKNNLPIVGKFWNGYVRVPVGHPLHGAHYDDRRIRSMEVHGGVTFSGKMKDGNGDDIHGWWLGFDTAHFADIMEPKDKDFVMAHTRALSSQIKDLA